MEASKPHVLITVLVGTERQGWVNPALALSLITMSHDPRFALDIQLVCASPVDHARNLCISKARTADADWLISIDNDVVPHCSPLDILSEATAEQEIISLSYGVSMDGGNSYRLATHHTGDGTFTGNFLPVSNIGAGVLMLRSAVWTKIPRGPWFRWVTGQDELLSPEGGCGEDVFFCRLAQVEGFKLWTHKRLAGHLKTADLTGIAMASEMQAAQR